MPTKPLKRTIQGMRFEWEGGDYIEITKVGYPYPFECINVSREDGSRPDFNKVEFMREIAEFKANTNRDYPRGGWLSHLRDVAAQTYNR